MAIITACSLTCSSVGHLLDHYATSPLVLHDLALHHAYRPNEDAKKSQAFAIRSNTIY
jgi:hypothetical protein